VVVIVYVGSEKEKQEMWWQGGSGVQPAILRGALGRGIIFAIQGAPVLVLLHWCEVQGKHRLTSALPIWVGVSFRLFFHRSTSQNNCHLKSKIRAKLAVYVQSGFSSRPSGMSSLTCFTQIELIHWRSPVSDSCFDS
jgi:hypothetical protein